MIYYQSCRYQAGEFIAYIRTEGTYGFQMEYFFIVPYFSYRIVIFCFFPRSSSSASFSSSFMFVSSIEEKFRTVGRKQGKDIIDRDRNRIPVNSMELS